MSRIPVGAAVIALTLGLGGCAVSDVGAEPAQTAAPTATPATSSPTPEATPTSSADPAVAYRIGDVLDEAELTTWFGRPTSDDDRLCYYPLRDGTYVLTSPDEPLPAVVTSDIQARLDAIGVDTATDNGTAAMKNFEAERALQSDVIAAGKSIVTLRLRSMAVPHPDGSIGGMRWVASAILPPGWWMQWETDRDVLVANVDAWVSQNTVPGVWVVFVGPGSRIAPGP